jgi:predicted TIM-barrel fold metal-dependent hydrolase
MLTRRELVHHLGFAGVAAVALRSVLARADMPTERTAVDFAVPPNSCDCHVHVFDPAIQPYAEKRIYTPPTATLDELLRLQKDLHLDRVVIVQPSVYRADNKLTIEALKRLGARARGVAVIGTSTTSGEIDEMHAVGVRGVRLNLETNVAGKFDADGAKQLLDKTAKQLEGRGWHVQFYTRLDTIVALKDHFSQMPFPLAFDHFGRAKASAGPQQEGFDSLLELVKNGHAYVKISGAYRCSEKGPDFPDVKPLAEALAKANPDRLVWGSDWPHPNSDSGRNKPLTEIAQPFPIDDGMVFNQVARWVPDAATRKKILVDNPARLYGFETQAS